MKYFLVITLLVTAYSCNAQHVKTEKTFEKAKTEFNLVTTKDFPTLNCSETINKKRMLKFFERYPQFQESVKIVSIPNCYGEPNEKFYVLLYDEKQEFYVPRSLPDVYRGDNTWPLPKKGVNGREE